jgi:hypothetical protein
MIGLLFYENRAHYFDDIVYLMFIINPFDKVNTTSLKETRAVLNSLKIKYSHYVIYSVLYAASYGLIVYLSYYIASLLGIVKIELPNYSFIEGMILIVYFLVAIYCFLELFRVIRGIAASKFSKFIAYMVLVILAGLYLGFFMGYMNPDNNHNGITIVMVMMSGAKIVINFALLYYYSQKDVKTKDTFMGVNYENYA